MYITNITNSPHTTNTANSTNSTHRLVCLSVRGCEGYGIRPLTGSNCLYIRV